ncbi:DUF5808 domain-containing protein [Mucilaginibacter sp. X5P1]|uniref:DUF5808 domain-containing protein n=1 Tax=Mucilaginibacter sp. X5P1 TaxID=2723088 RepID=UPI00161D5A5E|nr:DUF5808 domain-containing protein [Mucilaginibacter sp. X5P1]MBB6139090.1 putative membrane protein [Mucilaginibacter sp. X5P1]
MNEFDKNNYELWKWGIFYYNPNDPNVMVEKRSGLGWTFNFGHNVSLIIMGVILLTIIGTLLLSFGILKL